MEETKGSILNGMHFLCAEDNDLNAEILRSMLDLKGASCVICSRRPFGKTIPIIALTANAFAEDIVRSSEAGMDAHITKPIDENELKECMLRLLASR